MTNAAEDDKHWIWLTQIQIDRFKANLDAKVALLGHRSALGISGPYTIQEQKASSLVWGDAHSLVVDAKHVSRLKPETKQKIKLLRDVLEHWEEHRGTFASQSNKKRRAGLRFAKNFPGVTPFSLKVDANGYEIGGILNLDDLQMELTEIEKSLPLPSQSAPTSPKS